MVVMDKNTLVESIRDFKKNIEQLLKKVDSVNGNQIQAKALLFEVEQISTKWFEDYENLLKNSFKIPGNIIDRYRANFGKLLELCDGKPSKKNIQSILRESLDNFHSDLTVPIQKYQSILLKFPELDKLLNNVTDIEQNYLSEAISCARYGNLRASIILGWCAAVSRLHFYVDKIGIDKFNEASVQMFAIQSGRYKRFTKKFDIHTYSELQMNVFDNDLL